MVMADGCFPDAASCCSPTRGGETAARSPKREESGPGSSENPSTVLHDFATIQSGPFVMGTDEPYAFASDGEGPAREVTLDSFRIARHAVKRCSSSPCTSATG